MTRAFLELLFRDGMGVLDRAVWIVVAGDGPLPDSGWAALIPVQGDYGYGAYRFMLGRELEIGESVRVRHPEGDEMVSRECSVVARAHGRGGWHYTALDVEAGAASKRAGNAGAAAAGGEFAVEEELAAA